jgi:hypothetical protein
MCGRPWTLAHQTHYGLEHELAAENVHPIGWYRAPRQWELEARSRQRLLSH